jgi:hypothetical protein
MVSFERVVAPREGVPLDSDASRSQNTVRTVARLRFPPGRGVMATLGEKYLVDANGKTAAVVLNVKAYQRLLQRLEDLEDAVDLDAARRTAKSFRPLR